MTKTTLMRQLFVAGAPQLAALSVGAAVSFPSILIQQLTSEDSSMKLELDTVSWIGSIQGLAGIPSIFMPTIMQWKGRKLAFILACLISIIGWIVAIMARDSTAILISESFHGLGNNSLQAVSLLCISEMVAPQLRNVSMQSFHVVQAFGMTLVSVLGRYLHWRTVSMLMGSPLIISFIMGLMWPESPSWLAYKGKFDKCEQAFVWLRGTKENVKQELDELIGAEKEDLKNGRRGLYLAIVLQRDFYMPTLHMFMLLCLTYWSGSLVILIYSIQIVQTATRNESAASFGGIIINVILFLSAFTSASLIRRFPNKIVLLSSVISTVLTLFSCSFVSYLQTIEIIPKDSLICLYIMVMYMIGIGGGVLSIVFTFAVELMPVKHRGSGGAIYVIFTCVLHASSLKAAPYLFLYINLYGTFLLYALNAIICGLYVWKFVPETKGRTLQEIEKYYVRGMYEKITYSNKEEEEECQMITAHSRVSMTAMI